MGRPFLLCRDHPPGEAPRWLDFGAPLERLEAWRPEEVEPLLAKVEAALAAGFWAVGYLAYEAASALDPRLTTHAGDPHWPLAEFALTLAPRPVELPASSALPELPTWRPLLSEAEHAAAVGEIRAAIGRGETYQANFTFALEAPFAGDKFSLFRALVAAQQGRQAAFLDFGERAVLCASPELFFRRDGAEVVVRPMKGTARRGRFAAEDALALKELESEKNRAENLMIVDMMRNDLGKVAEPGSVRVASLFAAETYPTVHQLVSEVRARTRVSSIELLRALFPCASITGAPKAATQALLRRLEQAPRGVYTGAIGYLAPGQVASFAVAIRTITWRHSEAGAVVRFGTGGGIVWDSEAAAEYRECQAKAAVLTTSRPPFELVETLLWRPRSGFFLLDRHLERITESARYFGFLADRDQLAAALASAAANFPPLRCRVRLLLEPSGACRVEAAPLPCEGRRGDLALGLDPLPVDPSDVFLFHKTTHRRRYDEARARCPAAAEVALANHRGELTETTRGNLVLRRGREFLTPARECGLLAGTYRAELLARGRLREAILPVAALREADEVFHLSALRGWWRCRLVF